MRVALAHDYLREYGGAERVLETIHEIFPEAPIYTAYFRPEGLGPHAQRIKQWDIRTSFLQKIPGVNRFISPLRIIAPLIFQSFNLKDYDVVISSSAIYFACAVKTKPETLHLAYIHTPPRYLWGITTSFERKKHNFLVKMGVVLMNHYLRIWDFQINQRPDILVANSKNVQERIKKFYRRGSVVVCPPVEIEEYQVLSSKYQGKEKKYFLSVCRLWKNKNVDIVVEACKKLDLPLKVVGTGPEFVPLHQGFAGYKNIEFLGEVSDEEKDKLYAKAKALIVAAEDEDFGITPVEAQAAGIPVIAVKAGGFLETVVSGKTGEFFPEATVDSLVEVLKGFDPGKYDPEDCKKQAEKFSKERFKKDILGLIEKNLVG